MSLDLPVPFRRKETLEIFPTAILLIFFLLQHLSLVILISLSLGLKKEMGERVVYF